MSRSAASKPTARCSICRAARSRWPSAPIRPPTTSSSSRRNQSADQPDRQHRPGSAQDREVWAGFTQLNIPVFSDQNALPLLRRLEFEASWRHDQYSDVGGTSNAKLAFNWNPIESFTIRGGWGQSFRAPNFGEFSPVSNVAWQGWNFGQTLSAEYRPPQHPMCWRRATRAGSGAAKLYPRPASDAAAAPGGLSLQRRRQGPRGHADCGIIPTSNSRSSIPKRPSTGRSASTTRRPAIFSPA